MKVIFLDIDGVMQPFYNTNRIRCDLDKVVKDVVDKFNDESYYDMNKIDVAALCLDWQQEAIDYLKELIKQTDAKIVLSTGWRYLGYDYMVKLLKIHSLDQYVIGQTDFYHNIEIPEQYHINPDSQLFMFTYQRVIEILDYVRLNDIDNYVALDDMDLHQLVNHFVHITDGYFNEENYKKALKILK
ncbi:MAG: hypothetical protein LUF02_09630 [Erysipelotrichaceae bacterium]|nr:hypothetical protein [Erysipelotrichaceae bacterium]